MALVYHLPESELVAWLTGGTRPRKTSGGMITGARLRPIRMPETRERNRVLRDKLRGKARKRRTFRDN